MPPNSKKIKLVYFIIITLLVVGLVPLVLTGWFLSEKSGRELRAVENRYQTRFGAIEVISRRKTIDILKS